MRFPIVNNFEYDKIVGVINEDKIELIEEIDLRHYNISMCYDFDKITNGRIDPSGVRLVCASLVPKMFEQDIVKQETFLNWIWNKITTLFFRGKRWITKLLTVYQ
jgi:hypothetical protein